MKRYITLICFVSITFAQTPVAGRLWSYGNITGVINKNLVWVAMPGLRYEFSRHDSLASPTKDLYFIELLTGPTYSFHIKQASIKLPLWYYYMGFPIKAQDRYYYTHNIEFLPIVSYSFHTFTITSRTILHNTVYASVYDTNAQKSGYGLVIRQLIQVNVALSPHMRVTIGEEPFFGVIEDTEAMPHPLGYWQKGFRMNRVYAGFAIKLLSYLTISPYYVYETTYDSEGHLSGTNHYAFIVLSYVFKVP